MSVGARNLRKVLVAAGVTLLLASAAVAYATDATPTGITPNAAAHQSWHLTFDDEFNGTSLDANKWTTGWFGGGITAPVSSGELQCYDPAQVSVAGGSLHLTAVQRQEACGGVTRQYASGMVTSNNLRQFTYGAYEARIYLPSAPDGTVANWPAFWTDGQNWPQDGEMDLVEGLGGNTCYHFHSPAGGPGGCHNVGPGWHTFGANWTPTSVTYYYDSVAVGTINATSASPMYLILDNAVGSYGGTTVTQADMQVDYVRVWNGVYKGMP